LIEEYKRGELKVLLGKTPKESVETLIKRRVNKALNEVGEVIIKHMKDNPTLQMAISGARGDIVNIVQTAAMVGQEMMMGERIERGIIKECFLISKKVKWNLKLLDLLLRDLLMAYLHLNFSLML
jgi:DNA-directed RNA polymerase beta' subunit